MQNKEPKRYSLSAPLANIAIAAAVYFCAVGFLTTLTDGLTAINDHLESHYTEAGQ